MSRNGPPLDPRVTRRRLLKALGALGGYAALRHTAIDAFAAPQGVVELPFENGTRELVTFPQKRPLILLTSRPPQLETLFSVFNKGILTPNDQFFVRYHWSGIPTSIDPKSFRLKVGGKVNTPLELSLGELKKIAEPVDLIAVLQCSGNSRGHFSPRVNGGQSSNGAMGNARWTGVPLNKVLQKAGVQAGAVQVTFDGLDRPPLEGSPDFIKALDIDHAMDGEVMIAWGMNGEDLPMLNGYPLRLVVPGHYGTYWIKHLSNIQVIDTTYDGFWMSTAYRIPDNSCACSAPGTQPEKTVPIKRYNVRSFITNLKNGDQISLKKNTTVRGIAFDGGYGITQVSFSSDGGTTWKDTKLGKDFGKYSFREWTTEFCITESGPHDLKVRATNSIGQTQPMEPLWNSAGYMRNVVECVTVVAA